MDQQAFINEYINTLANNYKQACIDKVMLGTQVTVLTRQLEELKKSVTALENKLKEQMEAAHSSATKPQSPIHVPVAPAVPVAPPVIAGSDY